MRHTASVHKPVVTILGRPNVGKSTLFNRLTGKRIAIVENIPGVTRDRNYVECSYQGRSFILVDTGGLDPTASRGISAQIKIRTKDAIEEADILIVMFDGRDGVMSLDEEIVSLLRKARKTTMYVVNKIDTRKAEPLLSDFYRLGVKPLMPISAEHGIGVDELMEAILPVLPSIEDKAASKPEKTDGVPRIAVVGRPNVGKSTFVNCLIGEDRLITDAVPGTTRDAIDSFVEYQGRTFQFIDTAGIRRRGRIQRGVERYSISRALSAIERSDIAMVLMDASEGVVEQDTKIVGQVLTTKKGCILIANKWDLCRKDPDVQQKILSDLHRKFTFIRHAPVIFNSAIKGFQKKVIFRSIEEVIAGYTLRISTGELNRAFEKALETNPPPLHRGKVTKLYYITQIHSSPPTFVIFANNPKGVKESYRRYLDNFLRGQFGFVGTPLDILFRQRGSKR
jgi:GTPase